METIGKIRVDNGIRRIDVNDNGDFIEVSANDPRLFERFGAMLKWLEQQQNDIRKFSDDLDEKYKDVKESDAIESSDSPVFQKRMEVVRRLARLYEDTGAQLDAIFGPHTCDKVFGADVTPDEAMIGDFLDQLTPIMQKIADERGEKIRLRYSRSRGRHS